MARVLLPTSSPDQVQQNTTDAAPRVLIVRVGAMGDVLHGMPAVAQLREQLRQRWPAVYIGWAVEPRWASLLQADGALPGTSGMPLVDHVHPVPTRDWLRHPFSVATLRSIRSLRKQFRGQHYTVAIDLQGSIRSAVLCRLSGAPVIVGPAFPREAPARWLYTRRVPASSAHVIDQAAEIAKAAFFQGLSSPRPSTQLLPRAPLPSDPSAETWSIGLVGDLAAQTVVLAPTAGWGAKQWPAEHYGRLAAALAQRGYRVLLNSIGDDRIVSTVADTARFALPQSQHDAVQIVVATVPQLTALLRHASLLIAGDTGPLHLAAALGTPAVALFGPTDPARNGPYFQPSVTLRDPASATDHRRHAATEPGLQRISVDAVLQAALGLLAAGRARFSK